VSYGEASQFAANHNMEYIETSAKTGQNVQRVFEEMAVRICEKIENKSVDYSNDVAAIF
jgi:Ras-related protein Rab-2A